MQPYGSFNPMVPYFQAARGTAANVPQPGECGTYSKEMFREDFPQFCQIYTQMGSDEEPVKLLLPETMLQTFIDPANDSVLPSRWGSLWRYAAGLYVAHFSALYLKTYAPGSRNAAQAAGKASQVGMVKEAAMGDTTLSYDNSAVTAGTEKWGTWNVTQYGQQLVTMARQVGMGGMLV